MARPEMGEADMFVGIKNFRIPLVVASEEGTA